MDPRESIRLLEELSLNAWPSLQTDYYDGWVLRFSGGYTRRANSVSPIYDSHAEVREKVALCEQIYAAQGQDVIFKMTEASRPEGLDAVLAERGYHREALTSVQTLDLGAIDTNPTAPVSLSPRLSDEWLTDFCRLNKLDGRHLPTMTRMLKTIVPATCFATLRQRGETLALGMAVVERDYVGLYDIVTAEHARNRGLGRQLVLRLLHWAKANGASHAYLQVLLTNAPALRLYASIGFREVYRYWYRVRPLNT